MRRNLSIGGVDAVNTSHVPAGTFASSDVLSRREVRRFGCSEPFLERVRFPAAPQRETGQAERPGLFWFSATFSGTTLGLLGAGKERFFIEYSQND